MKYCAKGFRGLAVFDAPQYQPDYLGIVTPDRNMEDTFARWVQLMDISAVLDQVLCCVEVTMDTCEEQR